MLRDVLSWLGNLAVLVFAVTSMLSVGFAHSAREIFSPLRDVSKLVRALLANFVLVPLLGLVIVRFWPLERPLEAGVVLVAMTAGAPFLIKLTALAQAEVALSATLLVLLLPLTVVYAPIVVPRVLPEGGVNAGALAVPLVLTMLLPLAVGLVVHARWPALARRSTPVVRHASTVALVVLVLGTALANIPTLIELIVTGAIVALVLLIAGAFVIGLLLGGRDRNARHVLALGTAQRNISAATVMATQGFADKDTLVMVIAASLVGFALLFPAAAVLRRSESAPATANR